MTDPTRAGLPVCVICGAAISAVDRRLYGSTCPRRACRTTHWQQTARQLQEDKRRQRREAARRRQEFARAHCDRLAADLNVPAIDETLPVPVPAQQRPVVPLPEERKSLFREHLKGIIAEAFAATAPDTPMSPDADPANAADGLLPVIQVACAVCQGRCCLQGGVRAYLSVETMLRYRGQHPQATAEDVSGEYEAYLPEQTYEGSCVFHQEQGCGLPRGLRTDTCNGFECDELADLRREAPASGGTMCLVALDGERPVRWLLYRREG